MVRACRGPLLFYGRVAPLLFYGSMARAIPIILKGKGQLIGGGGGDGKPTGYALTTGASDSLQI